MPLPIRLKVALAARSSNIEELARHLGCHRSTLSRKLHGWAPLSADERDRVSRFLGRTVEELWPDATDGSTSVGDTSAS